MFSSLILQVLLPDTTATRPFHLYIFELFGVQTEMIEELD